MKSLLTITDNQSLFIRLFFYVFSVFFIGEFLVFEVISFGGSNDFKSSNSYVRILEIALCLANSILLIVFSTNSNFKFKNVAFMTLGLVISVDIIQSGKLASLLLLVVLFFMMAMFFIIKKHRDSFWMEMKQYVTSFAFGIFFVGFILAFVFSVLMGRDFFWTAVLEGIDYTLAKNAVTEGLKLFGLFLLLVSTIELKMLSDKR